MTGGDLIKKDQGTLELSGANTYTGKTEIEGGTLALTGTGSIADSSGVVLADVAGAEFDIQATSGATIKALSGGGTAGGNVQLGGNILTVGDANDTTFAGKILGVGGALVKQGTGTLTLTNENSDYDGGTTIDAGTVSIGNNGSLGSGALTFSGVGTLKVTDTMETNRALTLNADGTLDVDTDKTLTYKGVISGGSSLFKDGAGTLLLDNTSNTYAGLAINAGTVSVSDARHLGATSGTITLNGGTLEVTEDITLGARTITADTLNGVLKVEDTKTLTLGGGLSGTGTFTKAGGGTLEFAASSTSSSGFTQAAGTVNLSNATVNGTFTQNNGTLLSANGATLGAATLKGTVTPTGTLNTGATNFENATVDLANGNISAASAAFTGTTATLGNLSGSAKITATSTIDFDATSTIRVNTSSTSANTAYTLITAGSSNLTIDQATDLDVTGLASGQRYSFTNDGTNLKFSYLDTNQANNTLFWAGTSGENTWNTSAGNTNWADANGFEYPFVNGDMVEFDNSAAFKNVTVAAGGVSVGAMNVTGTGYTFSLTADAGNKAITSAGSIDLGTAVINITGYAPDNSATSHTTPTNKITIIEAGTLAGFDDARVTVMGQPSADFLTATAKQEGQNVVVETDLTWNRTNTDRQAHGTFTVNSGTFTLGAALADNTGGNTGSWDGATLTKDGAGTLILTANNNDYTGGTVIKAGTVQVEKDINLGRTTGELAFDGGILKTTGTFTTDRKTTFGDGISVAGNGTLEVAASTTLTHTGDLVGVAGSTLTKEGAGTLKLSGNDASAFLGTLKQDGGGIDLAANTDLSTASFTQTVGTLSTANNAKLGASSFKGTVTPTGTLNVASATFDGATINMGALSTPNTIASTGAVAFQNNNTTINVNAAGATGNDYTLISSSALTGNDKIYFNLTGLASGIRGGYYVENAQNLKLSLISGNTSLTWAGTSADNAWNTNSGNMNWKSTATGINFNFVNRDDVTFGASGHKRVAVAASGVQVGSMNVAATGYTFDMVAGATAIRAVDNIAFNNSAINLTGYTPGTTSPYTGPVNQVTLLESAMGTIGGFDPAKVTINNQSSVDFLSATARMDGNNKAVVETSLTWYSQNAGRKAHGDFTVNSGSFTLGAPLADNTAGNRRAGWDGKSLTKLGNGTLNLAGTHSYTGATNVNKGTLALADNARLGGGGDVNVASGAVLALAGNSAASVKGRAVVSGTVDVGAGGTLSFGGDVILKQNSTVKLAASNDSNLGKLATTGKIDIQGASKLVTGGEDYYKNQVAMTAGNGINGFANLTSDFFDLSLEDNKVVLAGVQSFSDIQNNIFPSQSSNVRRGGAYSDRVIASGNAGLTAKLESYITKLDTTALSTGDKYKAMRQLYGEYATVGHNVQRVTLMRHQGQIVNHMNQMSFNNRLAAAMPVGGASDSALAAYMAPPGVRPVGRPSSRYSGRYEDCYPSYGSGGPNRIWGGGFGAWADQDSKNGVAGYEFKGGGFTLGYDRQVTQSLLLGFAGSYMHGKTDVDGLSADYDHDVLNLSLYAGYYHSSNLFAKGGIGFGYGWNDYDVNMVLGGKRSGDYHTQAYNANIEVGYDWRLPFNFAVTPSVGIDYTYYRTGKWSESASGGGVANWFKSNNSHILDIPLAVRASYLIMLGGSRYIAPEIRVAWVPTIGNNNPSIRTGYVGSGGGMSQNGIDAGNNRWQFGAGVKAKLLENLEARLDYKYEVRSRYDDHNLSASVGLSF